jgi:hypothetical protein
MTCGSSVKLEHAQNNTQQSSELHVMLVSKKNILDELSKPIISFNLERILFGEQRCGILQYQTECADLHGKLVIQSHAWTTNSTAGHPWLRQTQTPYLNASLRLERDDRVPLPRHAIPPCRTDPPPHLLGVLSGRIWGSCIAQPQLPVCHLLGIISGAKLGTAMGKGNYRGELGL